MAVLFVQCDANGAAAFAAAHQPGFHHKPARYAFGDDIGDGGLFQAREVGQCRAGANPLLPEEVDD